MGLVFYDTETTGLHTAYDQIVQFAAIQTNADLEIEDRFETECHIQPHIIPSPGALLLNGIGLRELYNAGLQSHYEMVCNLRAKLEAWCPATFVGYNSISFDEHLLRQAFYQCLFNPYLTNRPRNARSDVMRLAQAASALVPGSIAVPQGANGHPTYRLEPLAKANGFSIRRAHDAREDVEATLHLAHLIMERAGDVWSTGMQFAQKSSAVDFIKSEPVFCVFKYYAYQPHAWFVTYLGANPDNGAEAYTFDLSFDPSAIAHLAGDEFNTLLAERKTSPVHVMKTNAAPYLLSAVDAPEFTQGRHLNDAELERRAAVLADDPELCARLIAAFEMERPERTPSPHVEEQIYDGFTSDDDWRVLDEFHATPWSQRHSLLQQVEDQRMRRLGLRLIYFEQPHVLTAVTRARFARALAHRVLGLDLDNPWLTIPTGIAQIRSLEAAGSRSSLVAEYIHAFERRTIVEQQAADYDSA